MSTTRGIVPNPSVQVTMTDPQTITCPVHGGFFSPFNGDIGAECPRCAFVKRDRAVNELTVCRALLDSYGFHQNGIHNGITAMWNQIRALTPKPSERQEMLDSLSNPEWTEPN